MGIHLWIAAGSAPGGVGRHLASETVLTPVGPKGLPWRVILGNVTGSPAIGFRAGA